MFGDVVIDLLYSTRVTTVTDSASMHQLRAFDVKCVEEQFEMVAGSWDEGSTLSLLSGEHGGGKVLPSAGTQINSILYAGGKVGP
ncbi:hypothetical protein I7I53_11381 [Histoplasma capsulatum var. duboisii H88]|uniref:Uncharacterized protein n=1 Tax=Ajellomyces capsulatus (strain H88) TaxID=544711 RepID=A0A8A1LDA1_AJEC8|nr:hypothetical protein I7I53_11381 [Histoplasma capsulatum var. duboisii H88]